MEALFKNFNPIFEGRSGNWDVDLRNFLEFYLKELHNETSCSSMTNFSQAAIVLQKSAYVYEKKVDYLWQLVMQLLDVVQLSKAGSEARSKEDIQEQSPVDISEPSTSKKSQGRKSSSNKPYLLEEFSQIKNKVSVKSLDMPAVEKTTSKPEQTLTRSAVFGRMVNIKKKRQHELYVFDKNEECMGKKDDFRISWSLNHYCALVEDPFDESVINPPPVSERFNVPIACDPIGAVRSLGSPGFADDCMADDLAADDLAAVVDEAPGSTRESPREQCPREAAPAGAVEAQVPEPGAMANPDPGDPDAAMPNVVGSGEPSPAVVFPDTPPDSQVILRDALQVDVGTAQVSEIPEVVEEEVGLRRSLRERNALKEGDNFNPVNFLFSASLLEALDDSTDPSALSISDKMRNQAKKVFKKGKRRFQEVMNEEGLAGFEEVIEEVCVPAVPVPPNIISDLPQDEVCLPQMNVPVPTPPPTPSNSQPMSPVTVPRTPLNDVPESRCPIGTPATPRSPEMNYPEEPNNGFDVCRANENDRSERVAAWHKSIKQRLEEANARAPFDVHVYGSKVITSFPALGSSLDFKDIVSGMDKPEIARIFLTSLMLANTGNVAISLTDPTPLPVNCMSLQLLSTQRHEEELEAFCAPSAEVHRRNNTPEQGVQVHRKRIHEQSGKSRSVPQKKFRV